MMLIICGFMVATICCITGLFLVSKEKKEDKTSVEQE